MNQALHSAIESINALSLEEKHQLWLILYEATAQAEEDGTAPEIQKVREEYKKDDYVIIKI